MIVTMMVFIVNDDDDDDDSDDDDNDNDDIDDDDRSVERFGAYPYKDSEDTYWRFGLTYRI